MRTELYIRATMTAPNEVFIQLRADDGSGNIVMGIHNYRSFINTLMTGSLASGDAGSEVILSEEGFDQWSSNKKEVAK